ncbi:MAG: hypothetical protein GY774_40150 [Planctomycetes bacterium]|nr:hypothetical protein [Planctomycetota bacterium]
MFMIDLGVPSLYSILGVPPDASVIEIREARDRVGKALAEERRLAKDAQEKQKLEDRQKEINAAGEMLIRPDKHEKYDRANAHLRFFVVRITAAPIFVEKADRIYVLHRIIRSFLAAKGVDVSPISDLDRDDFSTDETPNVLLDNLLR